MILELGIGAFFALAIFHITIIERSTYLFNKYLSVGDYAYWYYNEIKVIVKVLEVNTNRTVLITYNNNSYLVSIDNLYPILRYDYKKYTKK